MFLKNKTFSFSILALLTLLSCDKDRVFDQYANLDGAWKANEAFVFEYESIDTITPYNYFINMRVSNNFPFNNLFLIVETQAPSKDIQVDTLEYAMTKPTGELLGNGITDIKESKLWFKENEPLKEKGTYTFKVYQAVRETGKVKGVQELEGVSEVGFRIEKLSQNEQ